MLTWLLSFLSGPVISGLIDAYKATLASKNAFDQASINLAVQDLQAQIEARKAAVAVEATPWGSIVDAAFAFPIIIYLNKVLIWDKVLALGSTDPITGAVGVWVGMIISFYFGGNIVSKVSKSIITMLGK